MLDCCTRPPTRATRYLTREAEASAATCAIATAEAAVAGVDAVCHQAAMVGLGVDFGDIPDYVAHNGLGTAELLRALARARLRGPLVLAISMVVYGEGRYRCAEHGPVAPGPRALDDLDAGRFEPPCPVCGAPLAPAAVPEDAPRRSAQRLRRDQARTRSTSPRRSRARPACR